MTKLKFQKCLQASGFESRRNIRKFISEGYFKVNNVYIKDPNFLVDLNKDIICFKNKKINIKLEKKSYFIFNKPYGVVSTLHDPQERPTIKDFIGKIKERVYPVGRLDFHSEGLILLTNDGDLTNFIISTKNKIPKTYLIKIKGTLSEEKKRKLETKGFFLDRVRTNPLKIDLIKKTKNDNSWLKVTIIEGKKHILRKIFKFSGHPVEKLKRITIGNINLKKTPPGQWRELEEFEINNFKKKYDYK